MAEPFRGIRIVVASSRAERCGRAGNFLSYCLTIWVIFGGPAGRGRWERYFLMSTSTTTASESLPFSRSWGLRLQP